MNFTNQTYKLTAVVLHKFFQVDSFEGVVKYWTWLCSLPQYIYHCTCYKLFFFFILWVIVFLCLATVCCSVFFLHFSLHSASVRLAHPDTAGTPFCCSPLLTPPFSPLGSISRHPAQPHRLIASFSSSHTSPRLTSLCPVLPGNPLCVDIVWLGSFLSWVVCLHFQFVVLLTVLPSG